MALKKRVIKKHTLQVAQASQRAEQTKNFKDFRMMMEKKGRLRKNLKADLESTPAVEVGYGTAKGLKRIGDYTVIPDKQLTQAFKNTFGKNAKKIRLEQLDNRKQFLQGKFGPEKGTEMFNKELRKYHFKIAAKMGVEAAMWATAFTPLAVLPQGAGILGKIGVKGGSRSALVVLKGGKIMQFGARASAKKMTKKAVYKAMG